MRNRQVGVFSILGPYSLRKIKHIMTIPGIFLLQGKSLLLNITLFDVVTDGKRHQVSEIIHVLPKHQFHGVIQPSLNFQYNVALSPGITNTKLPLDSHSQCSEIHIWLI